jgi:transcriptional regulator with XRE-family HTH domain
MDLHAFGRRLAEARSARALTQDALARLIEVQAHTISRWERGAHQPEMEQVAKLSDQLGVSIDWLVLGRGDGPVPTSNAVANG